MDAVLSGRAGAALLWEQGPLWLLRLEQPRRLVPARLANVRVLLGDAVDLAWLNDTDFRSVVRTLEEEHLQSAALDLTLICVDATLSLDTRKDAIVALNELLESQDLISRLEFILYSKPFSLKADVAGAVELAFSNQVPFARGLFQRLVEVQLGIIEVRSAWDAIPTGVFRDTDDRPAFESLLIGNGFFQMLALARGSGRKVDEVRLAFLTHPLLQTLPNHREVLQEWVKPFVDQTYAQELIRTISREDQDDTVHERDVRRPRSFDRVAHFEKTKRTKQAIVKAMQRRDFVRARNLVEELIGHHMAWDGPRYAVMSLCDLATEAKSIGAYSLQLELTDRSIQIQPHDAWSLAQHGDALYRNKRFREALTAYQRAIDCGAGSVAHDGRAQVFKELCRFDEALATFDATIARFPEDSVPKCGRAELLKEMGRLQDALESYDNILAEDPRNRIARTARAEVLRESGRFKDALDSYDGLIDEYPEDIVPQTGRAGVLRDLGRLEDALRSFDEIIAKYGDNVFSLAGRAEMLKALGRTTEALEGYDSTIVRFPENVRAKNGRAELLKEMRRMEESLDAYNAIIAEYPEAVIARCGRAGVLKAMRRLPEALTAYDAVLADFPEEIYALHGRISVLLSMGRYEDALRALPEKEHLVTKSDWVGYHLRGMILLSMGEVETATKVFERGSTENPWTFEREYFRTALAAIRVRQRSFPEAAEILRPVNSPPLQPAANVLRVHSFGELGDERSARDAFQRLKMDAELVPDDVFTELHRRYILKDADRRDDAWLNRREIELMPLLVAQFAQSSSSYSYQSL